RGLLVLVTSGRRPAHLPVPYTTLCRSGVCTGQSVEEGVSQTAESLVEADPCPALTPVPAAGVPDPDALDARRSTGPPLVGTNSPTIVQDAHEPGRLGARQPSDDGRAERLDPAVVVVQRCAGEHDSQTCARRAGVGRGAVASSN